MKIIVFQLIDGSYYGKSLLSNNISILSCFLTDDVGPYGESFIEFIKNPSSDMTIRNYSCVIKEGNDVLVGRQFDKNPYEDCVRMPQKEFLSMLGQWRELVKQDPQEIIMYKEGESYRLEGHGFPDKQE